MLTVLTCIFVQHDLRLVVLAAVICMTACGAAFSFHLRSRKARGSTMSWAWMALTGLVAGSGVWATHFVAMLAYLPGVPIGYAVPGTIMSLMIAVVGMGLGFALPVLQGGRAAALAGGVLTGSAVAAMHFSGIAAMRTQARFEWDPGYVVASVLVGALGAAAAFYARARLRGRAQWAAPAVALLLAIVGLHFTAMAAVTLVPDPTLAVPGDLIGRGPLAVATVALALLILAAAASLIWMERVGRRFTLSGVRDALDVLSAGLAFYDAGGRLTSWNHAFAELVSEFIPVREGVMRRAISDAAREVGGWRLQENVEAAEQRGTNLLLPDGRWIRHESFATHEGGAVTVMTDITEQQATARILAQARDTAEAANRAKSQFLANMSHEIRTPLNGVLGVAEVLGQTELTAKQRELLSVIQNSGELLNDLLSDLLDLAKVEAGVVDLRPEPTDMSALMDSVRDLFAARAEEKGLVLRTEIGPGAGDRAACDPLRIRQIIGNLVSNAIKFTDAGQVAIALAREGDRLTFEVRDTGAGFDEATKTALFQRFRQADASLTRKQGGTGLGLPLSREYVRMMGAELECSSTPGEGSVFRFTVEMPALPLEAPAAAWRAADSPPGRFRVLVVDDNAVNRQVLGLILDSVGIEHSEAENGQEGVEAVITGGFDAVLMDLQMPVMDGFEAMRRIRAWESESGRPRMPIYVVSANCLQEHVTAGAAAGADGHLNKPISVPQLLAVLEPHAAAALAA
ncbi:MHYT domain-containing protein [uncultured Phenylobacterium sp.]|uniref:MHYT domain-containing protein n=1 Tax=uncultured Phenylobacterium sp. TaxID=349273 RepID=UPI0025E92A31|nr:MHYT domain-containing protein [uncultured Phenylobacterium sp.]